MALSLATQETARRCGGFGRDDIAETSVPDDKIFYEELIAPLESRMMRSIWRVVRQPDLAEDALQDALAIVWRKRALIRRHPNPRALILKICLNAACDMLRKRKRRLPYDASLISLGSSDVPDVADRDGLERKLLEEEVLNAIGRLPKKQAAAVLMRIVQDQPYEEIAAALGCSEVTARIQVSKGRNRLSRWLCHLRPGSPKEGTR